MICAIMQPTYLPWAGYFNLIASVDRFVFLDDVQFERRSWQSRNRILLNGSEHYLTVPVIRAPRDELVMNIQIDYRQCWYDQHMKTLKQAYGKAPFGSEVLDLVGDVIGRKYACLAELNESLISALSTHIGLMTPFSRASSLCCVGKRSEHIAKICQAIQCAEYLSPAGSREYMTEENFAENSGIIPTYQNYLPSMYSQQRVGKFFSHLSIIDVLVHHGNRFARTYIEQENKA